MNLLIILLLDWLFGLLKTIKNEVKLFDTLKQKQILTFMKLSPLSFTEKMTYMIIRMVANSFSNS